MVIILISGYATSGKDTFGTMLAKYLPHSKIFHFADPIKECAKIYFNWDGNKDERGRKLLQQLGQAGREYDNDIWVKKLLDRIEKDDENIEFIIIPDWRFKNEFEFMSKQFGNKNVVTVRIKRQVPVISDISEKDLDDFTHYDFIIDNNSSLDDLEKQAQLIVPQILKRRYTCKQCKYLFVTYNKEGEKVFLCIFKSIPKIVSIDYGCKNFDEKTCHSV